MIETIKGKIIGFDEGGIIIDSANNEHTYAATADMANVLTSYLLQDVELKVANTVIVGFAECKLSKYIFPIFYSINGICCTYSNYIT